MWDLFSRAGREGWEWEELRQASCLTRWSRVLLLHVGSVLLTFWIHPDQTCQDKSWLYFKSHYSSSVFHHPADTHSLLQHHSLQQEELHESLNSWWEVKRAAIQHTGLPPRSLLLLRYGAQPTKLHVQPFLGLNNHILYQRCSIFLDIWDMMPRCWEVKANAGVQV